MSDTPTDRTHPDFPWTGGSTVATNDDIAAAIAHVKAWVTRLMGLDQPPVPGVTTQPADGSVPVQASALTLTAEGAEQQAVPYAGLPAQPGPGEATETGGDPNAVPA